ncbi:MAG: PepSY domain-containing protein [Cyanosarcina radialis HA8281-LM2]|jgi:uncharacterized iron-regulated membrane protein|nr:PepSY domain-containing protein [Cyanosarcina radialis HA8281-LM2]
MKSRQVRFRQLHRALAPVMIVPLLISLTTGTIYQILDVAGKDSDFRWLLDIHKGDFGILNLEAIYPFLNALGLLVLLATGFSLWWQPRRKKVEHQRG